MRKAQHIFLSLFMLMASFQCFSQMVKRQLYATGGLAFPILDSGIGLSAGLSGNLPLYRHFHIDGQISMTGAQINGTFISGRSGSTTSINALVGLRLYFNHRDKNKFFINYLLGGGYVNEELSGLDLKPEFDLAGCFGAFLEFNSKTVAGISFETPEFLILKVGFRL